MKKILLALGLMTFVAAFTACNQKELEMQKATIDSLQGVVNAKDTEIDDLFQMLNEIEGNLSMINSKYSSVQEMRRNDTEGNYNHKQQIADQMSSIENLMADNKAKIAQLNSRVSSLNKKNADLQAYITKLEERSAAQEAQIAELLTELENNKVVIKGLNQSVTDLTASNKEKDDYIARQVADANRAYFVVGSYSDLKEAGYVCARHVVSGHAVLLGSRIAGGEDVLHYAVELLVHLFKGPGEAQGVLAHFKAGGSYAAGVSSLCGTVEKSVAEINFDSFGS